MADLDVDAELFAFEQIGDGDPVEAIGDEFAGVELVVGAYGDLVLTRGWMART